ncbi:MAG: hypothetical protein HKP25_12000, partial [Marinicaulis sp.]|nr:hypothetical protein [Marinicaulis sp.]
MKFRKFNLELALASAASTLAITASAYAGEAEDALIEKVVEAYGGDAVREISSIRIQDYYRTAFPGQGYT